MFPAFASSAAIASRRCCSASRLSRAASAIRSALNALSSSSVRVLLDPPRCRSLGWLACGLGTSRTLSIGRLSSGVNPAGRSSLAATAARMAARLCSGCARPGSSASAAMPPAGEASCLRSSTVDDCAVGGVTPPGRSRSSELFDESTVTKRTPRSCCESEESALRSPSSSREPAPSTRTHHFFLRHDLSSCADEPSERTFGLVALRAHLVSAAGEATAS
mmetsp:Transcript_9981/g.24707  ORF Transcript_9981/g.24707 Transcript_9981/m.24707 type:complete len:220 (+) Transcript_9981:395-1054(+)